MKFSNQILTVLSITTSIFVGIVHAEQVCDCGTNTDCDQVACDVAACALGGCNQDNTGPKPECAAGGCSQRGTKNPQCAGGNCCWDFTTFLGEDCAGGGCNDTAAACSTWPAPPMTDDMVPADSGSSTVFISVAGIVAATAAACVVASL